MSSADLIAALQKNDKAAKKLAFDTYYGKLAAIANRYSKNQAQADEILIIAFTNCLNKLQNHRFSQTPDIDAFFEKEFILECIAFIKNIRSEYYVSSTVHATGDASSSKNYNLFENQEIIDFNNVESDVLIKALQQMVPSQRLIFNLHVIDGFNLQDASAMLESSEATVKSNLEKARFNFQKNIEKSIKTIKA
jgi:RNA polymerase sigma factor (sigma-70 family)